MNVSEFDIIAREVFAPIYPVIAGQIKQKPDHYREVFGLVMDCDKEKKR